MNIFIKYDGKKYSVNLLQLTQLVGQNIQVKAKIMQTLTKHFSSSKYTEYERSVDMGVTAEGKEIGRNYFKLWKISNRDELISAIKIGKNSLLKDYLVLQFQNFNIQMEKEKIDFSVSQIFNDVNLNIKHDIGNIALNFSSNSILDILINAEVEQENGGYLEMLSNFELILTYLNLIGERQQKMPEKLLLVFENLDHLVSKTEYVAVIEKIKEIIRVSDSWFAISTSLEGFIDIDEEYIEGINVFNDIEFTLPDLEHFISFIEERYPIDFSWDRNYILRLLELATNQIGLMNFFELRSYVVAKIINDSLLVDYHTEKRINSSEMAFLLK